MYYRKNGIPIIGENYKRTKENFDLSKGCNVEIDNFDKNDRNIMKILIMFTFLVFFIMIMTFS